MLLCTAWLARMAVAASAAARRAANKRKGGPPGCTTADRERIERNKQKLAVSAPSPPPLARAAAALRAWHGAHRRPVRVVQEEQKVRELFEKHDSDSSDSLDEAQMKTFMEEYVHTIPEYAEKHVSDEEVKYVMAIADSLGDGAVEAEEITEAVAVWQSLLGDQDKIAARFDVYDTDKSGDLDKGQVALVLKDLNGGAEVGDEEVDWVMNSADGKGPLKLGAPLCPLCRQPSSRPAAAANCQRAEPR